MNPPVTAAASQKKEFETTRKLEMVLEWLEVQVRLKQRAGAYGRMQVELILEAGGITRAKIVDEITVNDLTEKERELVLRSKTA